MHDVTLDKILEIDGKLLPINTQGKDKGCHVTILKRIDEQLMAMLTHHNKVLIVRVDIHLSPDVMPSDNAVMSHYIRKVRKWAQKKYRIKNLGFAWCRELCSSKKVHYHVFVMIDGNVTQDHRTITAKSKQLAENYQHLGYSSVPYLPDCFHMVRRGDKVAYNTAFRHMSYIAKERTKDKKYLSDKGKNYSTSRLKPSIKRDKSDLFTDADKVLTTYFDKPQRKPSKPDNGFTSADDYLKKIAAKANHSKQVKPIPEPRYKVDALMKN